MKKLFLTITLLIFVIALNGQNPWTGFFKKADIAVEKYQLERTEQLRATPNIAMPKLTLLIRPSLFLTALAIDFSEKPAQVKTVSSVGIGLSVGNFSEVNGEAYCNYSINASLLTNVKLGEKQSLMAGGAITVDAYNKLIGAGVGYINKYVMPLITISYSF